MNSNLKNMILAALFLAMGLVLPFFTGQIPAIGNMLLPMHLPVFLCAFICGWPLGALVGFILPLLRYVLFSMPIFMPTGLAMAFELASYGLIGGYLYSHDKYQCVIALYKSMIIAMVGGRIIWGMVQTILLSTQGNTFTLMAWISAGFINAIPGIILQLILIPSIMVALNKTGLVEFKKRNTTVRYGE